MTREIQGPRRPARHRTGPGAHQRSRLAPQPRAEFPREISTGGLQDLTSAAQLAVSLLPLRDPLLIIRRGPGPHPAVDFRLLYPGPQSLRVNAQMTPDPGQLAVALTLSSRTSNSIFTARSRSPSGYFRCATRPCILPGFTAS